MLVRKLRHLRVFLSVAERGSVTQAIAKLESNAGMALFQRTQQGLFPTEARLLFRNRVSRAQNRLDLAMVDIAPRLTVTATRAHLTALVATVEAQNFTLAAHRLGIAQPTVHRAVTSIEGSDGRALFQRSPVGVAPTRQADALARAAQLAFAELDQAVAEMAELPGREVGEFVIGSLPLARSHILPQALSRFRNGRPLQAIRIVDGTNDDLLVGFWPGCGGASLTC